MSNFFPGHWFVHFIKCFQMWRQMQCFVIVRHPDNFSKMLMLLRGELNVFRCLSWSLQQQKLIVKLRMHMTLFFFLNALEILTNICSFAQSGAQALLLQGKKICQKPALGAPAQHAVLSADSALCHAASGHWQRANTILKEMTGKARIWQIRGCGKWRLWAINNVQITFI